MRQIPLILVAAMATAPSIAPAQGLVPSMDSEFEFCQDRPSEPDWMQNIPVRESYKRLLVQSIYRLEGYQRAANAGNCTCDTLFPPWTDAVQHFNDNYLHLEQFEAMQTRREFQDQGTALRRSVRELCEAEGNW